MINTPTRSTERSLVTVRCPSRLALVATLGLAIGVTSTGCAKKSASKPSDSPTQLEGGAVDESGEDVDDPLAQLDALESRMRQLGMAVGVETKAEEKLGAEAEAEAGPVAADDAAGTTTVGATCEDRCGLREAICELEGRICELSESHSGDTLYADACERAIDDCELATEACDTCRAG